MPSGRQGSIRLFSYSGIDVFLHWSWFLVAVYEIQSRAGQYSSIKWNILEYLGLFLIVLCHEFGHALACRQVGGFANRIVLWPLGGVAYVDPPQRPGATLWSIAAGPLVNVVLIPILAAVAFLAGLVGATPDLRHLLSSIAWINAGLLVFNILPVYPLDGGQILRSLLWFVLGRARSLMTAAVIGLLGSAGFIALAFWEQDLWLGLIAVYMAMNCWGGFQQARSLLHIAKLPRRNGYTCPTCNTAPPLGPFWKCSQCGEAFDTFETGAVCPSCRTQFPATRCLDCGRQHALHAWASSSLAVPQV
ncbi:MAG TPA: site-2 protease family protein [Candidatus Sulfotelmatobacter sp.]|nr:site-2 protease family protein [Candidatus Sulfotelmatobacter sp.]